MNDESSRPRGQLIPHTSCKVQLVEATMGRAGGICSVANMGMGFRTLEYQTNETEQLLEEKAINAFKDAVKTRGRAGR